METITIQALIERLHSMSIWTRIFRWKEVLRESLEAKGELGRLQEKYQSVAKDADALRHQLDLHQQQNHLLTAQLQEQRSHGAKLEERALYFEKEGRRLEFNQANLTKKINDLEQLEPQRIRDYDRRVEQALAMQRSFEEQRDRLNTKIEEDAKRSLAEMKDQWKVHEDSVKNYIKGLCERNVIEYVDEWPGKGKPDNVIKICDELIVFDAKSPASDDLSNFNTYLKAQAESVSKYLAHENVRKDIYLVIPSNTFSVIKKFVYNLGQYTVYVVTRDALEPIILSLKKIEEYEFAEQLSPDDRQNICRVIGGLLNASKRRIQVDHFFNSKILELINVAENNLPEAFKKEVNDVDKGLVLNPPTDKRSKQVLADDLRKRQALLGGQAVQAQIAQAVNVEVEL